ncbi:MAG: hypothetical protein L3J02_05140, partial [Henriciella sp.]|nr:hypothetical protein [Henriciella sp.]
MSSYGSWSVKGIDDRARAVAKEKARLEGVTLGDYINGLLLQGHSEAGPRDYDDFQRPAEAPSPLDGLTRRIEAAEARSTLAITGIDQSVLGLLARLENTENTSAAMAAEVETMIDELRETQEALQSKVVQIETDDTAHQNLQAMKALEQALGKLATHVYEESSLAQDETGAIKGRMESGFADLSERVEGMEVKVESTLSDAAARVEKAVQKSELRAEGTSRHLSERFSAIESTVATKLAKVDDVDARMKVVESDVSGALTSMEGTLVRVQERLNRAENTTDAALKALEQTFASLDERIETVAVHANPERAEALRQQIEARFDGLAADLRASIEDSRAQLANEIEQAAAGENPELMGRLENTIDALKTRLSSGEERSSRALEAVNEQVNRIATGLDSRLRSVEDREDRVIEQVSAKMDVLADHFENRVSESEVRSAGAIEQVGEQVASAINRVQARQETATKSLEDTIAATNQRQEARLSQALSNISERLNDMQSQTISFVSPVQKAIASLAARLESVEDFNNPPHAETPSATLPEIPSITAATATDEQALNDILNAEPQTQTEPPVAEQVADIGEADEPARSDEAEFIAGYTEITPEPEPETGRNGFGASLESLGIDQPSADTDYAASTEDDIQQYLTDSPPEATTDPLVELGGNLTDWDDGRDETRDSDIFADDQHSDDIADVDWLAASDDPLAETVTQDGEQAAEAATPVIGVSEDTAPALEVDDEATDYLARARKAAISAAAEIPAGAKKARRSKPSKTKKSKPAAKAGGGKSGGSALPAIAAASVLAVTTAGAGAYIALRGKQDTATQPVSIARADLNRTETAITALIETPAPSLAGVTYAEEEAVLNEELFAEEGSTTPIEEPELTAAPVAPRVDLPLIPKRLTLERAASNGDPVAQYKLGEARLADNDYIEGPDLLRRAAQQGLPAAQYRLAKLHEKGLGVPRDLTEARAWTQKAARGGNVKAMHDLAVFFADGDGGPQSYAGAVEWFRKAAEFGVVDSQFNLAVLYENGLGISPSQTEALYWYEIAARNGDASAPGNVTALREALSLEEAQTAQRRAATWTAASMIPASNGEFEPQDWE